MAIRAYKAGDPSPASQGDYTKGICDDDTPVGAWVAFVLKPDSGEYHPGPYYPMLGGNSPAEFRFSTDGTDFTAGPWGGTVNVGSVSSSGRAVWVQKKSWSRAQLLCPQGGIHLQESNVIDLGFVRSTGLALDIVAVGTIAPIGSMTDTGKSGMTAAPLGIHGAINIGALTDTGRSVGDSVSLGTRFDLGAMVDTGVGRDAISTSLAAWIVDLPAMVDTGVSRVSVGSLAVRRDLQTVLDSGRGSDTTTLGSFVGVVDLGALSDSGAGSDVAPVGLLRNLGTLLDVGKGSDLATVSVVSGASVVFSETWSSAISWSIWELQGTSAVASGGNAVLETGGADDWSGGSVLISKNALVDCSSAPKRITFNNVPAAVAAYYGANTFVGLSSIKGFVSNWDNIADQLGSGMFGVFSSASSAFDVRTQPESANVFHQTGNTGGTIEITVTKSGGDVLAVVKLNGVQKYSGNIGAYSGQFYLNLCTYGWAGGTVAFGDVVIESV